MKRMDQNTPAPAKNKNVFYVGLLSFFGGISQDMFAPILPLYLTSVLGFDKTFVGVTDGIVAASSNIAKIASGYFSDKWKRQKPLIFLGYLASMLSRPLLALLTSNVGITALRFVDGIGRGFKDPPKAVLIAGASSASERGKSFGIARMLDTLGSVAGPLILFGILSLLEGSPELYENILLLSAIPVFLTLLVLGFKVKENETPKEAPPAAAGGKLSLRFYLFLVIAGIFALGNSSDAFLVLRATNVGISLRYIPLLIALFNLVYAAAAVPFGALSDRIGRVPALLIGWAAYALVYAGFGFASEAYMIWILYALYGVYYATSEGVAKAYLADMVSPEARGRAFGLYGMVIGFSALPASVLAGFMWDNFGARMPFYFGSGMALVAALLLLAFAFKFRGTAAET
jgi:MFS family permease